MNSKYLYIIIGLVFIGAFVLGVFLLLGSNDSSSQNIVQNSTTGSSKIDTNILKEGEKAPDFSVTTIDGVDLTLSDFENKTLVLTSGAAWCPTCII